MSLGDYLAGGHFGFCPDGCLLAGTMSQCAQIAEYLEKGGSLTVAQALTLLGVYALSQRVGELKRQGMPIKVETVELPNGKHVARYSWNYDEEKIAW